MADVLRSNFDEVSVSLIKSAGGVFEVTVDGKLIYSKKQTGEHTTPEEILELLAG